MQTTRRTKFINLSITPLLKTTLLLFSIGIIVVVAAPHANAFKDIFHADINDESLAFLKSDILSIINTADISAEDIKKFKTSIFHLYSCDFQGTTENINRLYDQLLINRKPETFGLLLHPVQDFYAHSNWVELERKDLIDTNDGKWTVLKPFQEYKGIIIVQGEDEDDDNNNNKDDIHIDYTLSRTGKVVYVSSQSYENRPGLISGVYGSTNNCPEDIALDHDTLNKDIPDRVGYPQARVLAEAQTIHEWCRLLNLVELSHGQAGVQLLFDSWVEDKEKANSVCHRSTSPYVPPPSSPFSLPSGITTATETPSETK
jgi:hypothetical protein